MIRRDKFFKIQNSLFLNTKRTLYKYEKLFLINTKRTPYKHIKSSLEIRKNPSINTKRTLY